VDGGLWWMERRLSARRRVRARRAMAAAAAAIFAIALLGSAVVAERSSGAIVVGSKNFTEQVILGELLAPAIQSDTGLAVDRALNLGGTLTCDRALSTADIDGCVAYTRTSLPAVFHQRVH